MNRIFNTIFDDRNLATDPQQRMIFVNACSEFLDRLIADLTAETKCLGELVSYNSRMTHDYQRFAYGFDPEDESSRLFGFISALTSVGHMGVTMCTLFEQYKNELDGLLLRATAMRGRFNAFPVFAKKVGIDKKETRDAFDSLKFDFTSEILDHCVRLYGTNLDFCKRGVEVLQPFVEAKTPEWTTNCCALQKRSLEVRKVSTPKIGDAALNRGVATPVFGTHLNKLLLTPGYGIPQILFDTSEAIMSNPKVLSTEGLFRVAASKSQLEEVKEMYDKGQNVVISAYDPHIIAGVMKLWLRELPDSVIPAKIAVKFAAAAGDNPIKLKELLPLLPDVNRRCLHKLIQVGVRVAKFSSTNKMTPDNVARIFGPNIIRREDELNPLTQVANLITLANNLIVNYDVIFGPFKP